MEGEEEKRLNTKWMCSWSGLREKKRREVCWVSFSRFKHLERRMNHEIKWRERNIYNLMFEKMCLKGDVWEYVNCLHNKWREKDVFEKFK